MADIETDTPAQNNTEPAQSQVTDVNGAGTDSGTVTSANTAAPQTLAAGTGTEGNQATEPKATESQTPETYDFSKSMPEGFVADEETTKAFSDIARGLNLSNDQANQLAAFGMRYAEQMTQAYEQAQAQQQAQWADETKKALGAKFNDELGYVGTAVDKLETLVPGFRKALNVGGIGNRVEIIKALAEVGRMVAEDPAGALSPNPEQSAMAKLYPNTDFSKYK